MQQFRVRYFRAATGPHLLPVTSGRNPKVVVGLPEPGWYTLRSHDSAAKPEAEAFITKANQVIEKVESLAKPMRSHDGTNPVDNLVQQAKGLANDFAATEVVLAGMSRSGKSTIVNALLNRRNGAPHSDVARSEQEVLAFEDADGANSEVLLRFRNSVMDNPKYQAVHAAILNRHDSDRFASARLRGPMVSVEEDDASSSIILPVERGDLWSVKLGFLKREAIEDLRESVAKAVEQLQEADDAEADLDDSQEDARQPEDERLSDGNYQRIVQLFDLPNDVMIEADSAAIRRASLRHQFEPFVGHSGIRFQPKYNNYEAGAEAVHDFQLQFVTESWSLYPLIDNDCSLLTTPSPNLQWNLRLVDTPGSKEDYTGRQHLLPEYTLKKKPAGCIVTVGSNLGKEAKEAIFQGELLSRLLDGELQMAFVKSIDLSHQHATGRTLLGKADQAVDDMTKKANELMKFAATEYQRFRTAYTLEKRKEALGRIKYIPVCSAREDLFRIRELQDFITSVHHGCAVEHNVKIASQVDKLLKQAIIDVDTLPVPEEDLQQVLSKFHRIKSKQRELRQKTEQKWNTLRDSLFAELRRILHEKIRTSPAEFERRQGLLHIESNNYHRLMQVLNEMKTPRRQGAFEPGEADPRLEATFVSLMVGDIAISAAPALAKTIAECVLGIIDDQPEELINETAAFQGRNTRNSTLLHLLLWKMKERLRSTLHDKLQLALTLSEEAVRTVILIAAVGPCTAFTRDFHPKKAAGRRGTITSTALNYLKTDPSNIRRDTTAAAEAALRNTLDGVFKSACAAMLETLEREVQEAVNYRAIKSEYVPGGGVGRGEGVFAQLVQVLIDFQQTCHAEKIRDYEEEITTNVFQETYRHVTGKNWQTPVPDTGAVNAEPAASEVDLDSLLAHFDQRVSSIPDATLMQILSKWQVSRHKSLKRRDTMISYVRRFVLPRYQQSFKEEDDATLEPPKKMAKH